VKPSAFVTFATLNFALGQCLTELVVFTPVSHVLGTYLDLFGLGRVRDLKITIQTRVQLGWGDP